MLPTDLLVDLLVTERVVLVHHFDDAVCIARDLDNVGLAGRIDSVHNYDGTNNLLTLGGCVVGLRGICQFTSPSLALVLLPHGQSDTTPTAHEHQTQTLQLGNFLDVGTVESIVFLVGHRDHGFEANPFVHVDTLRWCPADAFDEAPKLKAGLLIVF